MTDRLLTLSDRPVPWPAVRGKAPARDGQASDHAQAQELAAEAEDAVEASDSPSAAADPWADLARALEEDPRGFRSLLEAIDAPSSLQCLRRVVRNLGPWILVMEGWGRLDAERATAWTSALARIGPRLDYLLSGNALDPLLARSIKRPGIHGLCASHPVYALFAVLAPGTDARANLDILLACAWSRLQEGWPTWDSAERAQVCRSLRAMYDEKGPYPPMPMAEDATRADVIERLEARFATTDSTSRGHLERLAELLKGQLVKENRGRKGSGWHTRSWGGFIRGTERLVDEVQYKDTEPEDDLPEDEEAPRLRYRASHRVRRLGDDDLETEHLGLAPGDQGDGRVVAQFSPRADLTVAQRLDRMRRRVDVKRVANEIAMRAQSLPARWELLTPAELGALFAELHTLLGTQPAAAESPASDGGGAPSRHDASPARAALVLTMLTRGLELEERDKRGLERLDGLPGETIAGERLLLVGADPAQDHDGHWYWHLRGRVTTGEKILNQGLVHPTLEAFCLPLPAAFARFYRLALQPWFAAGCPAQPFATATKVEEAGIKSWIKGINARRKTRITLKRIASYLSLRSAIDSGLDPVSLAYVRGQTDIDSATQAYYRALPPERIALAYSALWDKAIAEAIDEMDEAPPAWLQPTHAACPPMPSAGEARIGSRKVPKPQTPRAIATWLRQQIDLTTRADLAPWELTRAYHNAYTLYCLHFLLWASGARSARHPLPDQRFLNEASGLLVISDKSLDGEYSTRLVWVGDGLFRQMRHYRAHLGAVSARLLVSDARRYQHLKVSQAHWAGTGAPGPTKGGLRRFFFLLEDDRTITLTPFMAMGQKLPAHLQLPANCNRHYLATHLTDRGCPHELIDVQMGHWHHGREPWGRSSCQSPRAFARAIAPYLEGMVEGMGFAPLPSALVSPGTADV